MFIIKTLELSMNTEPPVHFSATIHSHLQGTPIYTVIEIYTALAYSFVKSSMVKYSVIKASLYSGKAM